jgi:hypothetical protein
MRIAIIITLIIGLLNVVNDRNYWRDRYSEVTEYRQRLQTCVETAQELSTLEDTRFSLMMQGKEEQSYELVERKETLMKVIEEIK